VSRRNATYKKYIYIFYCGASIRHRFMASPHGASRSHSLHNSSSVWLHWTGDRTVTETSIWQHTKTQESLASMTPEGFEPTIPASERPQTIALDSAATGVGQAVQNVFPHVTNVIWWELNYISMKAGHFGARFAELRKATIVSVMSDCSSACNNSAPTGPNFMKFDIWVFFWKSVENIEVSLKYGKNNWNIT